MLTLKKNKTTRMHKAPRASNDEYAAVTDTAPAGHDVWDDESVNLLRQYKSRCAHVSPHRLQHCQPMHAQAATSRTLVLIGGLAAA